MIPTKTPNSIPDDGVVRWSQLTPRQPFQGKCHGLSGAVMATKLYKEGILQPEPDHNLNKYYVFSPGSYLVKHARFFHLGVRY